LSQEGFESRGEPLTHNLRLTRRFYISQNGIIVGMAPLLGTLYKRYLENVEYIP